MSVSARSSVGKTLLVSGVTLGLAVLGAVAVPPQPAMADPASDTEPLVAVVEDESPAPDDGTVEPAGVADTAAPTAPGAPTDAGAPSDSGASSEPGAEPVAGVRAEGEAPPSEAPPAEPAGAGADAALPLAMDLVPGAGLSVDGVPVEPGASCTTATPPLDNAYCWDGGTLLILNDVNLISITASGVDLTVHLIGISEIAAVDGPGIAVSGGTLTFDGTDTPRVEIGTIGQTATAISADHLTVGVGTSTVTVRVRAGQSIPATDATVVAGNTYEYTPPGGGPGGPGGPGDPPGPPPGIPGTLSVGSVVLVQDGVRTANNVPGVTVDRIDIPPAVTFWTVDFDGSANAGAPTPYGAVEVQGSDSFFIGASGYASFGTNAEGLSFDGGDDHGSFAFIGGEDGGTGLFLEGGLASDSVSLDGAIHVRVGSQAAPSAVGVVTDRNVSTYNPGATGTALLEVFTTAATAGITGAGPGASVGADSNGVIRIVAAGAAFAGFDADQVQVAAGGEIDATFATLGVPNGVSVVWPRQEPGCIDVEAPLVDPTLVPADTVGDFGNDPDKRYVLARSATTYHLTSAAPRLVNFSWEEGWDATDPVIGGQVCVLASRGWAQVDQGVYFSFMIEEGSEVTLLLLPDHEYQFVSGEFEYAGPPGIGGGTVPVEPITGNAAQYTFTMPALNLSLSAVFEPVADPAGDVTGTDVIVSAGIEVPAGDIHGNAQLDVDDLPTPPDAADFVAAAGRRTIAGYVDLSLEQQIQQGDTGAAWVSDVTTLSAPAEVTLELDKDLRGFTDYVVLHDTGSSVVPIPATYDSTSGTLTFATDGFSPYAIAHGAPARLAATGAPAQQVLVLGAAAMLLIASGLVMMRTGRRLE